MEYFCPNMGRNVYFLCLDMAAHSETLTDGRQLLVFYFFQGNLWSVDSQASVQCFAPTPVCMALKSWMQTIEIM